MENTNQLPTFVDFDPSDVVLMAEDFEVQESQDVDADVPAEIEATEETEASPESVETTETIEADPLAQATYEAWVEKGLLEADDEFDGTFEAIDEKLNELPVKLLNKAIDDLPEHSKPVLKFIATAGQNLTPDELKDFMREYLGEQNLPDVSTADSAREFLEEHLKTQGLRPNAIQAQLDDLEDSNELISEAEKLLSAREKKTQSLIENKAQENKDIDESQKQFFQSVQTALVETKWAKSQQDKILQTAPKANDIVNNVIKQPKAYIQLLDFLSKFDGKEFDMEAYRKQGEARATSSIKEKIEKSGYTSGSKTKTSSDTPVASGGFKDYDLII